MWSSRFFFSELVFSCLWLWIWSYYSFEWWKVSYITTDSCDWYIENIQVLEWEIPSEITVNWIYAYSTERIYCEWNFLWIVDSTGLEVINFDDDYIQILINWVEVYFECSTQSYIDWSTFKKIHYASWNFAPSHLWSYFKDKNWVYVTSRSLSNDLILTRTDSESPDSFNILFRTQENWSKTYGPYQKDSQWSYYRWSKIEADQDSLEYIKTFWDVSFAKDNQHLYANGQKIAFDEFLWWWYFRKSDKYYFFNYSAGSEDNTIYLLNIDNDLGYVPKVIWQWYNEYIFYLTNWVDVVFHNGSFVWSVPWMEYSDIDGLWYSDLVDLLNRWQSQYVYKWSVEKVYNSKKLRKGFPSSGNYLSNGWLGLLFSESAFIQSATLFILFSAIISIWLLLIFYFYKLYLKIKQ